MTLLCITCVRHECNHVPEVAFKTLGDLAYMFCTSSLITNGSIYYDLLLHARRVLETKLKIVYSPPVAANQRYARSVIEEAMHSGPRFQQEDSTSGPSYQSIELLLTLANGDWRQPTPVHHCSLGCCESKTDTVAKMWLAILDVVFHRRPETPVLSRWTSCGSCVRFFLLASCFHNLFHQAWLGTTMSMIYWRRTDCLMWSG